MPANQKLPVVMGDPGELPFEDRLGGAGVAYSPRDLAALRPDIGQPFPASGMGPAAFDRRTGRLTTEYCALWGRLAPADLSSGHVISHEEKLEREAQADRSAAQVERLIRRLPPSGQPQERWREELLACLRETARDSLGYPEAGLALLFTEEALEAVRVFIREARIFDPQVSDDSLFQALRNLWVFQSLQLWLDSPVSFSAASFGYSLLYPYTDNYLDDPKVEEAAKGAFGLWLERRLGGLVAAVTDPRGQRIGRLVSFIEEAFPRAAHREVFLSLSAIHQAQMNSLRQQDDGLDDERLLGVTVAKGGTSVLADAYLVRGRLAQEEAEFAFGLGVLLQFLDDLQDVRQDLANRHTTPVTRAVALGPIDASARRLWSFTQAVLWRHGGYTGGPSEPLERLIQSNCEQTILQTVGLNPGLFSPAFVQDLESRSPFHFDFLRRRERTLAARGRKIVAALRRRNDRDPLWAGMV